MRVAVVGAGIIGLYLAWKLAKQGHQVTVFEKKKEITGKVCSGLVSERLKNFIPGAQMFIENKIDFCLLHFSKKTIKLNFKPAHLVIDREKLVQHLFELGQKLKVKVYLGETVNEIPKGFDRVIGCDGALSTIRERLGLKRPLLRLGLQWFQEKEEFSNFVETWPIKGGFCWKIPRGRQVEYGALGPAETVKKHFQKFLWQNHSLVLKQTSEIKGALIPQGLVLPKRERITLCGDAAGLTKPWSGGGIIWGLLSADILIKNFPDFLEYQRECRKFFRPKLIKAKLINPLVRFFGNSFPFLLPSSIIIDNDFLQHQR